LGLCWAKWSFVGGLGGAGDWRSGERKRGDEMR